MSVIPSELPIHAVLSDIGDTLKAHDSLVLEAPPGAGKTTCVPLALMDQPYLQGQKIIMLEPRRIAARAAAERMAAMLGESVGQRVGYRIRQESKDSKATRVLVVTEGILTRWLQQDPSLEGVGLIIFDEFHERHLDSDLGLALCLQSRELFREGERPLKLLLMSATLDGAALSAFLDQAPCIRSEGRSFPVDIHYSRHHCQPGQRVDSAIKAAVLEALNTHAGSVLVFLPGRAEIEQCRQALKSALPADTALYSLYGGMPLEAQREAIQALKPDAPFKRKVVLTTDIAETSLTIDGVHIVVDSGLVRVPVFDPRTGMTRLDTQRVSQSSSVQRSGRAGRLAAGHGYRLWPESQQVSLQSQRTPEIMQADLSAMALQLIHWGVAHPSELRFLNPPTEGAWQQALALLNALGALDTKSTTLTEHGRAMLDLPAHPRLAHMMLRASAIGLEREACEIAAILSEADPLPSNNSDASARCALLNRNSVPAPYASWAKRCVLLRERFRRQLPTAPDKTKGVCTPDEVAGLLLALAYPDRIAQQQGPSGHFKLANGRQALLGDERMLAESWIACAQLGGRQGNSEDRIFLAAPLNPELFEGPLDEHVNETLFADWQDGRFQAYRQYKVGALEWRRERLNQIDPTQRVHALVNLIRQRGLSCLYWNAHATQLLARLRYAYELDESAWPNCTESELLKQLEDWLGPYLNTIQREEQLKKLDLSAILLAQLDWGQQSALASLLPERIEVPSGSNVSIDYTQTPPVLAVKLQEMFGCTESPRIFNGKLVLSIHLLSPAGRPLQITQDLAAFWTGAYQEVKKEMKGRYPKHPWPDDPMQATATRFTKKRLEQSKR